MIYTSESELIHVEPQRVAIAPRGEVEGMYHGRQDALQDCAKNIEDIAGKPDNDELERESVGAGPAKVFEDLRREDDDPAGDGDGAGRMASGLVLYWV